ncbi:hypothetical protein AVEN_238329-1 [Araneus ventricosus]|uniref:Uncharacterized protein n=1 Tax=Araneus ventricosus TaxID=182803 RepID=A0A4Y2QDV8_ARAVE|nr:hypothetical protein AVEN_238329-1 [Araneus ventricosus]
MALQLAQNFSFLWGPGTCKPPGVKWSRNAPELCSDADAFYKNIVKSPQDRPIFVNQVRELNLRLHHCQPQFALQKGESARVFSPRLFRQLSQCSFEDMFFSQMNPGLDPKVPKIQSVA